jgi:hypothetical protein
MVGDNRLILGERLCFSQVNKGETRELGQSMATEKKLRQR